MARVTVFVDDAVLGRVPHVCVRTGQAADRWALLDERVGGPGWGNLLLLFLGPIGWVVYLLTSGGSETLTVRVPITGEVAARWGSLRRWRMLGWAAVIVAVVALVVPLQADGFRLAQVLVMVLGGAGLATVAVTSWRLWSDSVGVALDASRRWVTLTGVSQAFADAAAATGEHARHG